MRIRKDFSLWTHVSRASALRLLCFFVTLALLLAIGFPAAAQEKNGPQQPATVTPQQTGDAPQPSATVTPQQTGDAPQPSATVTTQQTGDAPQPSATVTTQPTGDEPQPPAKSPTSVKPVNGKAITNKGKPATAVRTPDGDPPTTTELNSRIQGLVRTDQKIGRTMRQLDATTRDMRRDLGRIQRLDRLNININRGLR